MYWGINYWSISSCRNVISNKHTPSAAFVALYVILSFGERTNFKGLVENI